MKPKPIVDITKGRKREMKPKPIVDITKWRKEEMNPKPIVSPKPKYGAHDMSLTRLQNMLLTLNVHKKMTSNWKFIILLLFGHGAHKNNLHKIPS